jgi:hypothetical protein
MIRVRAIGYALWFAFVPWRWYEQTSHYAPMGYWEHAGMNLKLALRWATGRETPADREFEREVNGSG